MTFGQLRRVARFAVDVVSRGGRLVVFAFEGQHELIDLADIAYIFPQTTVVKQDFIVNRGDTVASLPKKLSISVNPTLFKVYTRLFVKNFTLQAGPLSVVKLELPRAYGKTKSFSFVVWV